MEAKFKFYEIVKIKPDSTIQVKVHNEIGIVTGRAQEDDGSWSYAVSIPKDNGLCWSFEEDQLESTGKYTTRDKMYSGESIKVLVDPETGEGYLPEEEK